jgi:hypothetical protein
MSVAEAYPFIAEPTIESAKKRCVPDHPAYFLLCESDSIGRCPVRILTAASGKVNQSALSASTDQAVTIFPPG